jgi:hypothetical protein
MLMIKNAIRNPQSLRKIGGDEMYAIFQCRACKTKRVYGHGVPDDSTALLVCPREQEYRVHEFVDLVMSAKWTSPLPSDGERQITIFRRELGLSPLVE